MSDPFVVRSDSVELPTDKDGNIDTHNLEVHFGKHKGERWTRIPLSYLKFCVNSMDKKSLGYRIAKAELKRRGTIDTELSRLEVSYHAIDRASLYFMDMYLDQAEEQEGFYSWLYRKANAATKRVDDKNIAVVDGIKFVFSKGNEFYVLKTVVPTRKKK